jgi:hypothetical protein
MGTRADFYIGRGEKAEWLGSIAWDGSPEGIADKILSASSEGGFVAEVEAFFEGREDATLPNEGWPWPWNDSKTTDYAYCFDGSSVHAYCFGSPIEPEPEEDQKVPVANPTTWPDMKARKNVQLGRKSGVIFVTA